MPPGSREAEPLRHGTERRRGGRRGTESGAGDSGPTTGAAGAGRDLPPAGAIQAPARPWMTEPSGERGGARGPAVRGGTRRGGEGKPTMTEQSRDRIAPGRGRARAGGGREGATRPISSPPECATKARYRVGSERHERAAGGGRVDHCLPAAYCGARSGAERNTAAGAAASASAEERSGDGATLRDHPALDAG